ncbi:MAG TPA: 30S ribosomal protein S9 [Anaerolineales bacterium]|nr:30S ribosomal protein S9 [Anaerolineales bacterium]
MAQYYEGVGRRKAGIARVRVTPGSGNFVVNGKAAADFFTRSGDMHAILSALSAVGQPQSAYDVSVLVKGGGVSGQTSSVSLGLARALVKMNSEWTSALRKAGLLTRDARIKERKKPGLKKARKAPTYTKR